MPVPPMKSPSRLSGGLELALHHVEESSYRALNIIDMIRPSWIISHVLTGDVQTSTRGERWHAKTGDVMIHPPNIPFSEFAAGSGTHQWIAFDLHVSQVTDIFRMFPVSSVVKLGNPAAYSEDFRALMPIWEAPESPTRDLRLIAATVTLAAHVIDAWHAEGSAPRPAAMLTAEDRFLDLIAHMEQSLHEKITREDLAGRVFLHPGYFDRVFRATYGVSPMQMLRDMRLRRARRLLETTTESLESVASACGLGDTTNFSRVFRSRFGMAPGQYRESAKMARESYIPPLA